MTASIQAFGGILPRCGERVYIDPRALVVGDVVLGDDTSVWPMAVVRGDVAEIRIGERCNIQDGVILHVTHDGPWTPGGCALHLGTGVTIGHQAVLHGCTVGDFVLIGMGAKVLDGALIESHVMLAAGSLVPPGKVLRQGWLYRGSPAVPVRELTEEEVQKLEYAAAHYVRLKDRYRMESAAG